MARYTMRVTAQRPAEAVFDLMADMRNAARPVLGVTSATMEPGPNGEDISVPVRFSWSTLAFWAALASCPTR